MRTRVLAMLVAGALPLGAAPLHTQEVVVGGAAEEQDKPLDEAWAREQGVVLDYDEPPTPIKTTEPAYPKDALEKKVEGVVTVAFVIDRDGLVARAKVVRSVRELDAAAIKGVKTWRFRPAMKNGRPVATVAYLPIAFRLSSPNAVQQRHEKTGRSTPRREQIGRALEPMTTTISGPSPEARPQATGSGAS